MEPIFWGECTMRSLREISLDESPVSANDIGRICTRANRPIPECLVVSAAGCAEPEKMNCPLAWRSSMRCRATFHKLGANCHSSMRRGVSPSIASAGSVSARKRFSKFLAGSASNKLDAARCLAVVVFPHHYGPSISTAPKIPRKSSSSESMILRM